VVRELEVPRRRKLLIPITAAAGAAGLLLGVVLVSVRGSQQSDVPEDPAAASSGAGAAAGGSEAPAASVALPADPAAEPPNLRPCTYAGLRKRLVVGASKDVPLEMWGSQDSPNVAVGFGTATGMALGFVLDLRTMTPQRAFSKKSTAPLRRVVPAPSSDGVDFHVDVDNPSMLLRHQLSVPTRPGVRLGTFKQALTVATDDTSVPEILWQLPSNEPAEAMRAVAVPGKGLAVVFRRGQAIRLGWVDEARKGQGDLHTVPGSGKRVGAPSIGWNGREALIAFADQPSSSQPWSIRMARVPFGRAPASSFEWQVPAGGPGGAAMAPSVLGLKDGRWLVVWTEGKSGGRDVRVQTYSSILDATGDAFTVSQPGASAGQGVAAVGSQGGAVTYLSIVGQRFEVWGASISCP
jgi:hypothetical protein